MKRIYLKRLCVLFIFELFFSLHASPQDLTQTIRGVVVDAVIKIPIPGANIIVLDTDPVIGTTTDIDGQFRIENIHVGRVSIKVSFIGYKPAFFRNLILKSGKELYLNIKLEENIEELEEVVVKAFTRKDRPINEMAGVSARSFTIEETERFAGSLGDPSRMAQNYAGVLTAGDQRNDIIIRGNAPTGLLWRLDGVNIPNPNHFGAMGSSGGPISMLNNNLLTNSDFYTGAFPAEFGNALSGVFDLNMRNGNDEEREYTGQVGFNGFEFGAEGPFQKKYQGSYLVNYRYSTLAVMNAIGFDVAKGAIPQYQDLSFKLNFPTKKAGRFTFTGIGGKSYIEFLQDEEYEGSYDNPLGLNTRSGTDMGVINFSNLYYINDKTWIKTFASCAGMQVKNKVDTFNTDTGIEKIYYQEDNSEFRYSFGTKLKKKINVKNNFDFGVIFDGFSIDYTDSVYLEEYNSLPFNNYMVLTNTAKKGIFLMQAYGQWKHHFNDKVSIYGGLHYQYLTNNNSQVLEPRFSFKWNVTNQQSLSFGYGLHSQIQPLIVYYTETFLPDDSYIQTNTDLKPTRSHQWVLAYDNLIATNFRMKIETYYQHLFDVPVESNLTPYSMLNYGASFHQTRMDSLVNEGTGDNLGIEFTLEKFFSRHYYALLTISLFDSKYKTRDKIKRNTQFNGNYVVNALAGYEFNIGKKGLLSLDLKIVNAGGKRYLTIDVEKSKIEGWEVYDFTNAFEERSDPYFRLDSRISFKLNQRKLSQEWAIDLQNITNRQNIFNQFYDSTTNEVKFNYQMGFFPMFLYRINF
jgi:hypothetical protein